MDERHQRYMRRALALAERGKGTAAPNPLVGAVLVHNDVIIGEGWHHTYGEVHAEVDCLNNVAAPARPLIPQSTLYLTLEPCAHTGKQPPCAPRIVREGIKKIVVCNDDPFEKVSGAGYRILADAGIGMTRGVMAAEGLWQNRRFFTAQQSGRPYVILKWAQSRDGYIAPLSRARTAVSGHFSQTLSHKWRTEEGAIAVGFNTALHDNPQLTARLWAGNQPLRVVADRDLSLPLTHHLFGAGQTLVFNEVRDEQRDGVEFVKYGTGTSLPEPILARLSARGITSVIIEGGAAFLQSFIEAGLWDEARVFTGIKNFGEGIKAPALYNALQAFSAAVEKDELTLWQSGITAARCPYIAGMEL